MHIKIVFTILGLSCNERSGSERSVICHLSKHDIFIRKKMTATGKAFTMHIQNSAKQKSNRSCFKLSTRERN